MEKTLFILLIILYENVTGASAYAASLPFWGSGGTEQHIVSGNYIQSQSFDDAENIIQNQNGPLIRVADAIPIALAGTDNGVRLLHGGDTVAEPVSGDASMTTSIATGTTLPRTMADRAADTINLNNIVTRYDGTEAFRHAVSTGLSDTHANTVIMLPCGVRWPFYDTTTGYAWGPLLGHGVMYFDICGAGWVDGAAWATPALDRGLGDNSPVLSHYNGTVMLNRQNISAANGTGLFSSHIMNWATSSNQYPGAVDADFVDGIFQIDNQRYGLDGTTPTRGSPVALRAIVNNYSGSTWSVAAQAFKPTCNNFTWGGSCWATSTELNDKSGHSPKAWNLHNEVDLDANGPEHAEATYDPKQAYRIMDYTSAISNSPGRWSMQTAYQTSSQVIVTDVEGRQRILITVRPGVSGTTVPIPGTHEGTRFQDGSVTWEIGTLRDVTVGVAHFINRDVGADASEAASYNFGWSTNAKFKNAVFDTSHAVFMDDRAVALRMAPGQRISFNDEATAGKDADLNRNILTYNPTDRKLVYSGGNHTVFTVADTGIFDVRDKISADTVTIRHAIMADGDIKVGNSLYLGNKSRSDILSIRSPVQGMLVNDITDNVPVIYENGHWYPLRLGTELR